ncbi:MAG: hypothetical protein HY302_06595 [Opitutae bacterium]|nr:hypothetical protein [Opitutae bacterium]
MKTSRLFLSLAALLGALFLSGCMAAMIPAMVLGHASHGQRSSAHGAAAETCACARPADAPPDATAPPPVAPPADHDHRP